MTVSDQRSVHATGQQKLLGHLAALLFAILIAGSFSIGHKAAPFMDPAALNAIRFVIGAVMMGTIVALTDSQGLRFPEQSWRFGVLGTLFATYFITMFVALRLSSPVSTSAVFTLIPLMSAAFGLFVLGQRTRTVVLTSLLVAAAGAVWVIFRGDVQAMLTFDIGQGEGIFLFGCACHAIYAPLVKLYQRGESPQAFAFWTLVATAAVLVIAGARSLAVTDFGTLPTIVWLAIIYLAVFATALTTFLIQFAAVRLPASKVLAYGYLTPTFVIFIEGLTGFGWPTVSVLAGAVVTAMALLVMALGPDG